MSSDKLIIQQRTIIICMIQYFEADFLREDSLKFLNSGIILKLSLTNSSVLGRDQAGPEF